MGRLLMIGTHATDDPTKATMPFVVASGAIDRGHEPGIALMGEAAYIMKGKVADAIHGVGFPKLTDLMQKMVDHQVPIYV
jgi:uncharacterized protein involved in oxidation of intracellular sulfur